MPLLALNLFIYSMFSLLFRVLAFAAFAGLTTTVFAEHSDESVRRNILEHVDTKAAGELIFKLGDITYFTDILHPVHDQAVSGFDTDGSLFPLTHIITDTPVVTASLIQDVLSSYGQEDDVFNADFLQSIFITSPNVATSLDASAIQYLSTLRPSHLILDGAFGDQASNINGSFAVTVLSAARTASLPPGPFIGRVEDGRLSLSTVYRLYTDHYSAFVDGVYPVNDGGGDYRSFGFFSPEWPLPSIP